MSKKISIFGRSANWDLHQGIWVRQNFVHYKEMECIYCVVDLHAITVFQ